MRKTVIIYKFSREMSSDCAISEKNDAYIQCKSRLLLKQKNEGMSSCILFQIVTFFRYVK